MRSPTMAVRVKIRRPEQAYRLHRPASQAVSRAEGTTSLLRDSIAGRQPHERRRCCRSSTVTTAWWSSTSRPACSCIAPPSIARETRFAVQLLRDQLGRYVYPVHRLDKGTSGALAFALDPVAARAWPRLRESRQSRKPTSRWCAAGRTRAARSTMGCAPVEDDVLPPIGGSRELARTSYERLATFELPHRVDRYPTSRYALVAAATAYRTTASAAPPPRAPLAPDRRRFDLRQGRAQPTLRASVRRAPPHAGLRCARSSRIRSRGRPCASMRRSRRTLHR